MKNYKIIRKNRPFGANKTGIDFMTFMLIYVENCLKFNAVQDF